MMKARMSKFVAAGALIVAAGLAANVVPAGRAKAAADTGTDPYANLPASIQLSGTIRDVRERTASGGHPDFELNPTAGFAHYVGLVADQLDSDGKPVFASTGYKVSTEWRDAAGRNRIPNKSYIKSMTGDVNGAKSTSQGGAMTNASSFAQWYRNTPGVNLSMQLPITLVRQAGTNVYTFNDRTDPTFTSLGGFFPINGQLYGNSGGTTPNQNFHFTYEIETRFVYEQGKNQVFTFTGDDDVWVFVDGKLVIDLGGIHSAVSQSIELDRLGWLVDKQEYTLKFFFAERHRTQSNFRIDTTMVLRNVDPPATTGAFD